MVNLQIQHRLTLVLFLSKVKALALKTAIHILQFKVIQMLLLGGWTAIIQISLEVKAKLGMRHPANSLDKIFSAKIPEYQAPNRPIKLTKRPPSERIVFERPGVVDMSIFQDHDFKVRQQLQQLQDIANQKTKSQDRSPETHLRKLNQKVLQSALEVLKQRQMLTSQDQQELNVNQSQQYYDNSTTSRPDRSSNFPLRQQSQVKSTRTNASQEYGNRNFKNGQRNIRLL